jgi:hypothetical protein
MIKINFFINKAEEAIRSEANKIQINSKFNFLKVGDYILKFQNIKKEYFPQDLDIKILGIGLLDKKILNKKMKEKLKKTNEDISRRLFRDPKDQEELKDKFDGSLYLLFNQKISNINLNIRIAPMANSSSFLNLEWRQFFAGYIQKNCFASGFLSNVKNNYFQELFSSIFKINLFNSNNYFFLGSRF